LGLERYIDDFLDANIAAADLHNLNAGDLRKIGVRIKRHQNEILRAVTVPDAHNATTVAAPPSVAPVNIENSPETRHQAELTVLQRLWSRACDGLCQNVSIVAEAGLGKSALVAKFRQGLAGSAYHFMHFQCLQDQRDEPFYPVRNYLRAIARIEPDDSPQIKLEKLRRLLATTDPGLDTLPLFAAAMKIPLGNGAAPTPDAIKDDLIDAMQEQLLAVAMAKPVLILAENAQWFDPFSLELFIRSSVSIVDSRIMSIVSARPEYETTSKKFEFVRRLYLDRVQ
jgi:predicted ATPase